MMRTKLFALGCGALFLFIVGTLFGVEQLLFMSCVVGLLPVVAFCFAWLSCRGVEISREAPVRLREGERKSVTLRLKNCSVLPKFFLEVWDFVPEELGGGDGAGFVAGLRSKEFWETSYEICPLKRGVYKLGPAELLAADPTGIMRFSRELELFQEMVVYPSFPQVRRAGAVGTGKIGMQDTSIYATGGSGIDFYNIREYQPGDEFRQIHWKSTAKTGHLQVVEKERPSLSRVGGLLYFPPGSNVGQGREASLEYAVKLMAGLAWVVLENAGSFVLITAGEARSPQVQSAKDRNQFTELLETLARVEEREMDLEKALVATTSAGRGEACQLLLIMTGVVDKRVIEALTRSQIMGIQVQLVTFDQQSFLSKKGYIPRKAKRFSRASLQPSATGYAYNLRRGLYSPPDVMVRAGDNLGGVLEELCHAY